MRVVVSITGRLRHRYAAVALGVFVLIFAAVEESGVGSSFARRAVDDLGQELAAAIGAAMCFWRARTLTGRPRLSWALFGAALTSWASGQGLWSYYELFQRRSAPFPSAADLGYLLFPVLALPALLIRPSVAFRGTGRVRVLLDGLMVAAALFNLSWISALGKAVHADAGTPLGVVVSVAYPVGDLVLLAIAVLILNHARHRTGLLLLVAGLIGMALADSAFVYLTAIGAYATGSPVDIGWVAAFLLIGLSALLDRGAEDRRPLLRAVSPIYLCLPYLLLAVGLGVVAYATLRGTADRLSLAVGIVGLVALLLRQLMAVLDNRQLVLELEAGQVELLHRAFHDSLTGLANRALFTDRVTHALDLYRRDPRPLGIILCDLDNFKTVNDTLGHDAGDALLMGVADRLRAIFRSGDTVARLGGDEFGILIEGGAEIDLFASRTLEALARPMSLSGRQVSVHASIGVALIDGTDQDIDDQELLKRADVAMYAAKKAGKATVATYDATMRDLELDDLDLQIALLTDIGEGRIRTFFQPIFTMDGAIYGYEALARWDYLGRAISPETFIAVAERVGALAQLDMCVISNAIAALHSLPAGPEPACLTVNIGLSHLPDPGLAARLLGLLLHNDVAPRRLVVEIPEDRVIDDPAVLVTLRSLRQAGIVVALDDFGVGYSSLSRLGTLETEIVKLDRSFVANLRPHGVAADVLSAVVDLSHRLGARVIAEGIETEEQLEIVRQVGCDAVQGFLLGRPAAAPALASAGRRADAGLG
jgi:diguanylate cyclase (GGDEF)-like protein